MRPVKESRTLETKGALSESVFKINTVGAAFRSLIDGLYSNKIESPVRELAGNAFDSHIAAKIDAQFYVHAPNGLHKEFYVRDYGVGMSHQKVMTLYNTLFHSDKTESNDMVGMFGLGSKSPFAYTDKFFVACYDGSTVRNYAAVIGMDGVPKIVSMGAIPSDEPTGVRVGFPVKDADFGAFQNAIEIVRLAHPNGFQTNFQPTLTLGNLVEKTNEWSLYKTSSLEHGWYVRQGCVLYELERESLELPLVLNWGTIIIEVPIGSLEVTTSREAIAYSQRVRDYLSQRIVKVQNDVVRLAEERCAGIEGVLEYFCAWRNFQYIGPQVTTTHPYTGLTKSCVEHVGFCAEGYFHKDADLVLTNISSARASIVIGETYDLYIIEDVSSLQQKRSITSKHSVSVLTHYCTQYALQHSLESMNLHFGIKWDDVFYGRMYPGARLIRLTWEEFTGGKAYTPLPQAKPLEGIRILRKGTDTPVFDVSMTPKTAWISAKQFQTTPDSVFLVDFAIHYGITCLYVVHAYGRHHIANTGIPNLKEIVWQKYKDCGATHFMDVVDVLKDISDDYNTSNARIFHTFLSRTRIKDPASYRKLLGSSTYLSKIARNISPFAYPVYGKAPYHHLPILKSMCSKYWDTYGESGKSKKLKTYMKTVHAMRRTEGHPMTAALTSSFLGHDNSDIRRATTALLYLAKTFPQPAKWKTI